MTNDPNAQNPGYPAMPYPPPGQPAMPYPPPGQQAAPAQPQYQAPPPPQPMQVMQQVQPNYQNGVCRCGGNLGPERWTITAWLLCLFCCE